MSLARMHPRLCASAILLVGLVVGFAVHWTFADEHSSRLNAAQADVREVKLANSPTSSPESEGLRHAEAASAAQAG